MREVRIVRRGLKENIDPIWHLRGKIDVEPMLEALGIDLGYRIGPTQIMCHCPDWQGNHSNGDANPSFGFNEEKYVYNCFVCGGGTLLDLTKQMLGVEEDEAVRFLEEYSDLTPMTADQLTARAKAIMNPVEEKEEMPEYPPEVLNKFKKIHPYLYERGISKDVIMDMQVGFTDEHAGITIPHFFQGKLVGWQTRHLVEEGRNFFCESDYCIKRDRIPKYINTGNFPKQNTLYGYDKLKEKARVSGRSDVLVVESPMTALYLMSQGEPFDQVVATFGSFSMEQGMLLLPFERIYFWPDNDPAGYANADRARTSLMKYSNLMYVPAVPGISADAADLSLENLHDYLAAAYPASLFLKHNQGGKLATYSPIPNTK